MFWNITIKLIRLDDLCERIQTNKSNEEVILDDNTTTTSPEDDMDYDCDWVAVGFDETLCKYDTVSNVTIWPQFDQFQFYTEWYGITGLASVGILFNIITISLLAKDKEMRGLTKALCCVLLVLEMLYLGLVMVYIQLRHQFPELGQQVEVMAYVTMVMSYIQMTATWMTYILATDAYRALRFFQKPSKLLELKKAQRNSVLAFLGSFAFHVAYVPHIRTVLYQLDPGMYDPCQQPIVKQWDFEKNVHGATDLYYILYYGLFYLLVVFLIPFLAIGHRDKDIIDTIHQEQDKDNWTPEGFRTAETALLISVYCNLYLVCTVPKLAMLLFKIFDYGLLYVRESHTFFVYSNALANDFLIFKSCMYLPLTLAYSRRIAVKIYQATCVKCAKYRDGSNIVINITEV